MASKKKNFDIFNIVDDSLLDSLKTNGNKAVAPSKKEVELIKTGEGDVLSLPIAKLVEYHNHSYKVLDNEDMDTLVDSIRDYGVLLPLIVREIGGNKYEIVSGHRRRFAAEKLGLKEIPCKVMDLDDDMADIVMADTNITRETILPSEKAKTYKVRIEAAVRQGKKTMDELKTISDDAPDSVRQIQRFLKLNDLSEELLNRVDSGEIPVTAGVILAGLSEDHQQAVYEVSEKESHPITLKDAENLKKASARGLTKDTIEAILLGVRKPRTVQKKKKAVLTEDMISDVVPDEIKKLPLEDRVDYYKDAIKAYKPKSKPKKKRENVGNLK